MDLQRAAALWDLLVAHARQGRSLTYGEAAVHIGGIARGIGTLLQPIQKYCIDHDLPNLSVLVVKADRGSKAVGSVGIQFWKCGVCVSAPGPTKTIHSEVKDSCERII